jgi:hypothetical protein
VNKLKKLLFSLMLCIGVVETASCTEGLNSLFCDYLHNLNSFYAGEFCHIKDESAAWDEIEKNVKDFEIFGIKEPSLKLLFIELKNWIYTAKETKNKDVRSKVIRDAIFKLDELFRRLLPTLLSELCEKKLSGDGDATAPSAAEISEGISKIYDSLDALKKRLAENYDGDEVKLLVKLDCERKCRSLEKKFNFDVLNLARKRRQAVNDKMELVHENGRLERENEKQRKKIEDLEKELECHEFLFEKQRRKIESLRVFNRRLAKCIRKKARRIGKPTISLNAVEYEKYFEQGALWLPETYFEKRLRAELEKIRLENRKSRRQEKVEEWFDKKFETCWDWLVNAKKKAKKFGERVEEEVDGVIDKVWEHKLPKEEESEEHES